MKYFRCWGKERRNVIKECKLLFDLATFIFLFLEMFVLSAISSPQSHNFKDNERNSSIKSASQICFIVHKSALDFVEIVKVRGFKISWFPEVHLFRTFMNELVNDA